MAGQGRAGQGRAGQGSTKQGGPGPGPNAALDSEYATLSDQQQHMKRDVMYVAVHAQKSCQHV